MRAKLLSRVRLFATPWIVARQAPLSIDCPSKNTGVGCHALLQGIFLTQRSNPCLLYLLHWQVGSLSLTPPENSNYFFYQERKINVPPPGPLPFSSPPSEQVSGCRKQAVSGHREHRVNYGLVFAGCLQSSQCLAAGLLFSAWNFCLGAGPEAV